MYLSSFFFPLRNVFYCLASAKHFIASFSFLDCTSFAVAPGLNQLCFPEGENTFFWIHVCLMKKKKKGQKTHPTSGLKEIFLGSLESKQKAFLLKHNERGNSIHMIHRTASSFLVLAASSGDVFYLHIILADTSHDPCTTLNILEHNRVAENASHFSPRKMSFIPSAP